MKIHLTPKIIYGCIRYEDSKNHITASKIKDRWYPCIETNMFDAGFTNIACMTSFLENLDAYEENLQFLGYHQEGNIFVNNCDPCFKSEIRVNDDGMFEITSYAEFDSGTSRKYSLKTTNFEILQNHILKLFKDFPQIDIFASIILTSHENSKYIIEAKMSTRDLAKDLVRVKSSNVWAYGINIKDRKDKTGDVLVQFKDTNGGAGDIYQYLDVPVKLWRKILSTPSKGHAVHQYLRNSFKYRKLTGDKRGKLPNAIN